MLVVLAAGLEEGDRRQRPALDAADEVGLVFQMGLRAGRAQRRVGEERKGLMVKLDRKSVV